MAKYQYYGKISILWQNINIMAKYQYYGKILILCKNINIMATYYYYYAKISILWRK